MERAVWSILWWTPHNQCLLTTTPTPTHQTQWQPHQLCPPLLHICQTAVSPPNPPTLMLDTSPPPLCPLHTRTNTTSDLHRYFSRHSWSLGWKRELKPSKQPPPPLPKSVEGGGCQLGSELECSAHQNRAFYLFFNINHAFWNEAIRRNYDQWRGLKLCPLP